MKTSFGRWSNRSVFAPLLVAVQFYSGIALAQKSVPVSSAPPVVLKPQGKSTGSVPVAQATPRPSSLPIPSPSVSPSALPTPEVAKEPVVNLDLEAATDANAKPIVFEPVPEKRPQGLLFKDKLEVLIEDVVPPGKTEKEKQIFVTVPMTYNQENWEITSEAGHAVTTKVPGPLRELQVKVPVKENITQVPLAAISPKGEVLRYTFEVRFVGWEYLVKKPPKYKRYSINGGLATSFIFFNDSRFSQTSIIALSAKLGGLFIFYPPRWDVGGTFYINALPVFASDRTSYVRFLGVNVRAGYRAPWLPKPWQLGLYAGWYYTTMIVPTGDRGFTSMNGPQLYPTLTRFFENGNSVSGYVKYSPMFNAFSVMALNNFEVAVGASYSFKLKNGHLISPTLDFSTFGITLSGVRITTTTVSAGVAYGL